MTINKLTLILTYIILSGCTSILPIDTYIDTVKKADDIINTVKGAGGLINQESPKPSKWKLQIKTPYETIVDTSESKDTDPTISDKPIPYSEEDTDITKNTNSLPSVAIEECNVSLPPDEMGYKELNLGDREHALSTYIKTLIEDIGKCNASIRQFNSTKH